MKIRNITASAICAAVLAILAQIQVPIGEVPLTFSVLGVFLAGWALPPIWSMISMMVYLLLGAFGVPVFAGFRSGPSAIAGPTGGFLIAYPFMAATVSLCYRKIKGLFGICLGLLLAGVVCHCFGIAWLSYSRGITLGAAFVIATAPFIVIDLAKMVIAGVIMWRVPWRRINPQATGNNQNPALAEHEIAKENFHASNKLKNLTISAVLTAIAIAIPMIMPKIVLPFMSFTLASHVPIFLACFLSPLSAAVVSLGAAAGFLLAGLPIHIVLRAATHVVFAVFAAIYFNKKPEILTGSTLVRKASANKTPTGNTPTNGASTGDALTQETSAGGIPTGVWHMVIVAVLISLIHAVCETIVIFSWFFEGNAWAVVITVGLGTFVHSMIDFALAWMIWRGASVYIGVKRQSEKKW